MRKAGSRSPWHARGVILALVLAVGVLALFLAPDSAKADAPPYNVSYSVTPANNLNAQPAELHHVFDVDDDPWPAAMFENQVTFNPEEWGVATGASVPIGAVVGKLISDTTLGWFNAPCASAYGGDLHIDFDPLLNCSTNTADTITFDGQFGDTNTNNIPDGCDKYPDFLNTMFPGLTPVARYASFENIGIWVSVNFVLFAPETDLGLHDFPPVPNGLGYPSMSVVNDPTAPLVPNQITDLCPPMATDTYDYALTMDNPSTSADESGYLWRANPPHPGTYTFTCWSTSLRDADDDNIDNDLDTCPHIINNGDPRVRYSGDTDDDGLDSACDPTPGTNNTDPDGDTFPNRQDNCPLVSNASQADTDLDDIGDACDVDDWNGDGDTDDHDPGNPPTPPDLLDPGEPTGFDVNTPNGPYAEVTITDDEDITTFVGGLAELPDVSDSSSRNYIALAGLAAAALVALTAGTWYARRRWLS
jgi:hypothetical protein